MTGQPPIAATLPLGRAKLTEASADYAGGVGDGGANTVTNPSSLRWLDAVPLRSLHVTVQCHAPGVPIFRSLWYV